MVFRPFFTVLKLFFLRGRIFCEDDSTVNWRGERFRVQGVKGFEVSSLVWVGFGEFGESGA